MPGFHVDTRDLTSGLHDFMASILPMEPSPQPLWSLRISLHDSAEATVVKVTGTFCLENSFLPHQNSISITELGLCSGWPFPFKPLFSGSVRDSSAFSYWSRRLFPPMECVFYFPPWKFAVPMRFSSKGKETSNHVTICMTPEDTVQNKPGTKDLHGSS